MSQRKIRTLRSVQLMVGLSFLRAIPERMSPSARATASPGAATPARLRRRPRLGPATPTFPLPSPA